MRARALASMGWLLADRAVRFQELAFSLDGVVSWSEPDCFSLLRLARDHCFRSSAPYDGRWRKGCKIGVAAGETLEAYLAITDGSELAAQETWRGAMLGRRSEGVDDPDARVRLERGDQVVEQGIRPCDLVIHVHHNRNVDRISWQPRVVRLTAADCHVLQSEIAHPVEQAPQIVGHDIFCDDAAFGSDDRRGRADVLSAARADVRNCHPGFDAEQTHELARFVGIVALLLVVPDRAHDVRDRAIGFRKGGRRHARWRHEVLRTG